MPARLDGRVAVVTGGGRGIGAAAGRALAAAGARVVLTARTAREIEAVAESIGDQARAVAVDVGDWARVEALAADIGPVDILVNNAAVVDPMARLVDVDPAAWAETVHVNTVGAFNCLRAFLPGMLARDSGRVIAVGSSASERAIPTLSAYSAGKAGFEALHRIAAAEVDGTGVAICMLWPGGTDTPMQGRLRDTAGGFAFADAVQGARLRPPEEVADRIVELCTGGAEVNGSRVDLGDLV